MKKMFSVFFLILMLSGCTPKSKTAAIESAKQEFRLILEKEVNESISGHKNLKETAIHTLIESASYEVVSTQAVGDTVFAVVKIKAVDPKIRVKLFEIINKLDEWKDKRFNVTDAIGLIGGQINLDPNIGVEFKLEVKAVVP